VSILDAVSQESDFMPEFGLIPMSRILLSLAPFLVCMPLAAQHDHPRPKIYGIAFVRFKATDFEKSNAFYATVLGLGHRKGGCKGLNNPCYVINAYQHVELIKAKTGDSGSFLDEIGFTVFGVKQMQQYLTSHGVKTSKISRGRNQRQFFVAEDPDHNRIAFVEGPGIVEPWSEDAVHSNPDQVSSRIIHAGFVVKDLDLMKKFYLDLLGFRLYWFGGFKDDGIDWYEIQVPDGDNWVEFMLNIAPTADHQELGVQNHFSLGVTNANAVASKLREHGAAKFDGPEIGRDGKNSIDIYDPDLSRVEIMDFAPTKTPCCHAYTADHPKL
jgi:catechol 2,3-dioxygenase-like lactoylglutathione lyase family enzyme